MKAMRIIFIALCVVFVPLVAAFGQITTNGTGGGNWNSAATWAGGIVPSGSETITIASTDSVLFDVPVSITGTLVNQSAHPSSVSTGSLTFASGSIYQHAVNGGTIPIATWGTGSTCTLTGITGAIPANSSQNFYNFTYNCPSNTGNLNLGWNNVTIGGDVNILATGGTGFQIALSNNTFATNIMTINGNLNVSGATAFAGASRSSGTSWDRVIVKGSLTTDATCYFAWGKGSGCTSSYVVGGNVTLIPGTFAYGNTHVDTLFFTGANDTLTTNVASPGYYFIVVNPGTTLQLASSTVFPSKNNGFVVSAGATLACANAAGLSGNIGAPTITLSSAANYIFNGSTAQVTSSLMPATVKNVTINNAANVTSSQALAITDTLFLISGSLLGPYTAGTTTDVEEVAVSGAPRVFQLTNNFPNPFNPSTELRFSVPADGHATLKVFNMLGQEVATLFNGVAKAGSYNTVTFDASKMASGVYFARLQQNSNVKVQRMVLTK